MGFDTGATTNDPSTPYIEMGDQEDDEYRHDSHSDDVAEEEQPQPKYKQAEIQEERPIGRRPSVCCQYCPLIVLFIKFYVNVNLTFSWTLC